MRCGTCGSVKAAAGMWGPHPKASPGVNSNVRTFSLNPTFLAGLIIIQIIGHALFIIPAYHYESIMYIVYDICIHPTQLDAKFSSNLFILTWCQDALALTGLATGAKNIRVVPEKEILKD